MITVKLYDEWEFRLLRNQVVESRNEKRKLPWAERNADSIGFMADQLYIIGNSINTIAGFFPGERVQEIPTGAEQALPQEQEARSVI